MDDQLNHIEVEGVVALEPKHIKISTSEGIRVGLRFVIQQTIGPVTQYFTCICFPEGQVGEPHLGDLLRIEGKIMQRQKGLTQTPENFECYIQSETIKKAMFKIGQSRN